MRSALFFIMAIALAHSSPLATTYLVRPDGTGDYPTIQAAVDAVEDGDVIELADGTFTGDGNRDVEYLGKAITIRSQSGNAENCIIDSEGSETEPHRGFLFNAGEGLDSILEGVTVTGGYSPISLTVPAGGAINVVGSADPFFYTSPTIRYCRFIGNVSPYATGGVNFFISEGVIHDCYFSDNIALGNGCGALAASGFASVEVSDCVFENNESVLAGGGAFGSGFFEGDYTVTTFNDCVFVGNTGGTFAGAAGVTLDAAMYCNRCFFEANIGLESGGAVAADERGIIGFTECTFVSNTAPIGGVISLETGATGELSNCTLYENDAPDGCAFALLSDDCTLEVTNTIAADGTGGPAFHGPDIATCTFYCTDIYGNQGGDWTGAIADQLGVDGNISEPPWFCNAPGGDFTLHEDSPCAPFSPPNPECDLIGAWPVGCGPTPVQNASWGKIKSLFRR